MNKKIRGLMPKSAKSAGGKASVLMQRMGGVVGPKKPDSKAKTKPPKKAPIKKMY